MSRSVSARAALMLPLAFLRGAPSTVFTAPQEEWLSEIPPRFYTLIGGLV
jgi:hypothetical protein